MSLTDMMKKDSPEGSKIVSKSDLNKSDKTAQNDLKDGLEELAKRFKNNVFQGNIKIEDIKDAKDMVTIMQMLNSMSTGDSRTPALSGQSINFFQSLVGIPEGSKPNDTEIKNAVDQVQSDTLNDLLSKQANSLNKTNEESM